MNNSYSDKPLYCCFSVPQQNFFTSKGIRYELVALNPRTKYTMWVYMRDERLKEALREWNLGSKN